MTKKKSSSAAKASPLEVENADTGKNGLGMVGTDIPLNPIYPTMRGTDDTPKPSRRRPPPAVAAPLELDPQFIKDPARMQYALLLAMLLRAKGTVRFSAKDMEPVDTDYNVVFSRTRDGRYLEVSVVSSESGIIRSPEREAAQWRSNQEAPATFQPLPQPIPFPTSAANQDALQAEQLQWALSQQARSGPFLSGIGPVRVPRPETAAAEQTAEKILPQAGPATPKDGSVSYHFPFEVGSAPSTAGPADLSSLQSRLLNLDRTIETEQQEAIARLESP